MARAIERIERDILALEEATRAIAADLQSAYTSYLTTLGQVMRQELNQASYILCTQGYPEKFLSLSLNQRQQLQQAIRRLSQQASEQLLAHSKSQEDEGDEVEQTESNRHSEPEIYLDIFPVSPSKSLPVSSPTTSVPPITFPSPTTSVPPTTFPGPTPPIPPTTFPGPTPPTPPTPPSSPTSSSPIELATWQQNQERAMHQTLKKVSRETNLLLQKAGILPKTLPEPILEAAAAASETSAEVMPGPPNLVTLVIEIEHGQQSQDSSLTQIMAINLRLGEIEFADATLSSERKQIRHILVQLNKVGQEYQKKQRERSIAEAEAAWRASWFE
ncbi:MAG: primosomal protein [Stigonema ocellatum SAG 48.90 = DSM 106950]|nr:primosomal protein [Stigonema ocellatum SAG 48.90 = DSM 106950]